MYLVRLDLFHIIKYIPIYLLTHLSSIPILTHSFNHIYKLTQL